MIDLHVHSTFSDGSRTPTQLAGDARAMGLRALALTDHDSVEGVPELLEACRDGCVEAIPAVEFSAEVAVGTLHVLGYYVDPHHGELRESLRKIREGRNIRNRAILEKLAGMGMALTEAEVRGFAAESVVGRPHIARAMVERGYVAHTREAFTKYLGKGCPAYFDRYRLSPEQVFVLIRKAGGVPVLAHPFTLQLSGGALRRRLADLKEWGLAGLEVYYSQHTAAHVAEYLELARDLGLVVTGGSDFHGALNPDIRLGVGFGNLRVPDSLLDDLARERGREWMGATVSC